MKNNCIKKGYLYILTIPLLILANILTCCFLYLFEPISYDAPDLTLSGFSFDLYAKYSNSESDFYIKQITANDIVTKNTDARFKYVKNTILIIYNQNTTYDDIQKILSPYNGKICGYIKEINFIQAEFPDCDYPTLSNICSEINNIDFIKIAIIDYFEETPVSETYSYSDENDTYYYELINYPDEITKYSIDTSSVNVGVIDVLIDSNNKYLNINNKDNYNIQFLNNPLISNFNSHGTHVAGIIGGDNTSKAPCICPGVSIYSDNGLNNTISYWIASLTDMIINRNINVINISLGYNSFITLSASSGCEATLKYIESESHLFYEVLKELINDGYEFVICAAAGNDSNSNVNKIYNGDFSYGKKNLLNKLDIFNIFTREIKYCNSAYSLPISYIKDNQVSDRIIIVGACTPEKTMSYYSNIDQRIDIVAPGDNIFSFSVNGEYEYMSGTSMATPFVSGTAALLFAANPSLSGSEIKNIITSSATETVRIDQYEFPILNVSKALEMIK